MKPVTLVYVTASQPEFTEFSLEVLFENTSEALVNFILIVNGSDKILRNIVGRYKDKARIFEIENLESYSRVLNNVILDIETTYLSLVHNDTLVTKNWLQSILSIFSNYYEDFGSSEFFDLLELAGISPFTNYNEHHFLKYQQLFDRFEKIKPSTKMELSRVVIEDMLVKLYQDKLQDFAGKIQMKAESWYSFIPEISSFCCVLKTKAIKHVCDCLNERFVGAGGEIRLLCKQLLQAGYLFARANNVYVHHHGNLTNDGVGFNYSINVKHNSDLLEKVEVG